MKKYNAEQACLEVKRIVEDFGMDIILDTQRFSAALDDYLATMESEQTVLRNAMQAPLGTMLHEARTASEADQGRVLMQARQMLIEEYGLESRAASFSIDCIVYAIWPQEDAIDEEDELEELQRKAKQGDADAQYNLGELYNYGIDVAQDYRKAYKWYHKAADQGHADAQYQLGSLFDSGEGVSQNYRKAYKWYHKASDQGHAEAQRSLGILYRFGRGVARDDDKAREWYQKAAGQGDSQAIELLEMLEEWDEE